VNRIALVISDVDGTLLSEDKSITEGAISAVQRLRDADIGFTITSSRPTVGMHFLVEPLQITLPIGAFNGSAIVDPRMNPIEQRLIPAAIARRSLELLDEIGVDVWLFTHDRWLTRNGGGEFVALERWAIKADPSVIDDFTPYLGQACKIVGSTSNAAQLTRCEKATQDAFGAEVTATRSQHFYLDITPPGCDKGTFVHAMARRLAIPRDAIATIGDMPNDLAMFAASGLSFAMGNASDDVKRHAKRVTASNEEDGFAKAIAMILLENGSDQVPAPSLPGSQTP
jgi:Cof subfamily protein (haloacid dehalogenase superfamily)